MSSENEEIYEKVLETIDSLDDQINKIEELKELLSKISDKILNNILSLEGALPERFFDSGDKVLNEAPKINYNNQYPIHAAIFSNDKAPTPKAADGRKRSSSHPWVEILAEARDVLREKGSPVQIEELSAALRSRGITIGGTKPGMNLRIHMKKSGDFIAFQRYGWMLTTKGLKK